MCSTNRRCAATRILIKAETNFAVASRLTLLRACLGADRSPFFGAQAAREALATVLASDGPLPPDVALQRAAALYSAVETATQGEPA